MGTFIVSCAFYTVQLALGDLFDEDKYFLELKNKMKKIPHKLMYMNSYELVKKKKKMMN